MNPHGSHMTCARLAVLALVLALSAAAPLAAIGAGNTGSDANARADARAVASPPALPGDVAFEPNHGQADPAFAFVGRAADSRVGLTATHAHLAVTPEDADAPVHVKLVLDGADPAARVTGADALPGVVHHYRGSDAAEWVRDVPRFARVIVHDAWPGVDVVYRGDGDGRFEYDLVVAAGVDASVARVRFESVDDAPLPARVADDGSLLVATPAGDVRFGAPVSWHVDGAGTASAYVVDARGGVTFVLPDRDPARGVVIDPIVLDYASHVGGSRDDRVLDVSVDAAGATFLVGDTESVDFPGAADDTVIQGSRDAFVLKLAPDATIEWVAFFGGSGSDSAKSVHASTTHGIAVGGESTSTNFPTTPDAFDASANGERDGILLVLDSAGALAYASHLGGYWYDGVNAVEWDASGRLVFGGYTGSPDFPLVDAFDSTLESYDGFVGRASFSPATMDYLTLLGGDGYDSVDALALDSTGAPAVSGYTTSKNFPTLNAWQSTFAGASDAFVTRLAANGAGITFSTYLGGVDDEWAFGLDTDSTDGIVVGVWTRSHDYPITPGAYRSDLPGWNSMAVTRFDATGDVVFSTFYAAGTVKALVVDESDRIIIGGSSMAFDVPLVNACQDRAAHREDFWSDAVLAIMKPAGTALELSTYLGGNASGDSVNGLALGPDGSITLGGMTRATDLPTLNAFDDYPYSGYGDDSFEGYAMRFHQVDESAPDTQPPVTGHHISLWRGYEGWIGHSHYSPSTIEFTVLECGGEATTHYRWNGGAWEQGHGESLFDLPGGMHTFEYYSVDEAGNAEAVHTLTIKYDRDYPSVTTTVNGDLADDGWYDGTVTITMDATDGTSGIYQYLYSIDSKWNNDYVEGRTFTVPGGVHEVYARVIDYGNNQATAYYGEEFRVDTGPPVTQIAFSGHQGHDGWYRSSVQASLTATDDAGIASSHHATNGGEFRSGSRFSVSGDGEHVVHYYSVDSRGQTEAVKDAVVRIDATPPTVTFESPRPGGVYTGVFSTAALPQEEVTLVSGDHTIIVDATDALSGVSMVTFWIDGRFVGHDDEAPFEHAWASGSEETGEHEIEAHAYDHAGNKRVETLTVTVVTP